MSTRIGFIWEILHSLVHRCVLIAAGVLPAVSSIEFFGQTAYADLSVSTVAVFLSDANRNERICVQNKGNQSKDVSIEIRYGYPISDSAGNVTFRFTDPSDHRERPAVGWVRFFPDRFSIPPGGSQIVVAISDPPPDLDDGEYWARPVITSCVLASAGESAVTSGGSASLVISLNYRHGEVSTGIELSPVKCENEHRRISLLVDLVRKGNAAFLGSLVCRLRDTSGVVLSEQTVEVAVYHSMTRRVEIGLPNSDQGEYVAEIETNTSRKGGRSGDILPAPTASLSYRLKLGAQRTRDLLVTRDKLPRSH